MELIDINKEIVKLGTELGLTVTDDREYLKGNVLWIEELYKSRNQGNKSSSKSSFYTVLNIYETNANKAKLYNIGNKFSELMLNSFMVDNEEYEITVKKQKEQLRKVSMDTGKLYEYSFTFVIEAYKLQVQ